MSALKPCGSWAAYVRHIRHGEKACEACLEANRDRTTNIVNGPDGARVLGRNRARQRALRALAQLHPDVFEVLCAEELRAERLNPNASGAARDTARTRQRAFWELSRLCAADYARLLAAEYEREGVA